jgi:hypothetical protein
MSKAKRLQSYFDGDDVATLEPYINETIIRASMTEEVLTLAFSNGKSILMTDGGQCYCESRYMRTDDDLQSIVGARLLAVVVKDGPEITTDYTTHEQQFLEIQSSKGLITIANHNEHNGYYGGFSLILEEISS